MKLRADQLEGHLRQGLRSLYLVTGDEPLIVGEILDALRAAAREQDYLTREVYVAERGFDWNEVTAASASMSLFSERKVIDLRLPTGKPGDKGSKAIAALAESVPDDTMVIISAPKLEGSAMSSRWVKAIDKAGVVLRVWPLEAKDLPGWIVARMAQQGLTAERDAVLHLARRVEGNLLAAQQEIDKLALLHDGTELTVADMEEAVSDSTRFTVFLLADEVISGRVQRAVRMLGGLRREGVVPVLVLWALGREIRQLAAMREAMDDGESFASLASRYRIWNNRQAMYQHCLHRLGASQLHSLVDDAERCDQAAKGQSGDDPWQLLLSMTVTLATGRRAMQAA